MSYWNQTPEKHTDTSKLTSREPLTIASGRIVLGPLDEYLSVDYKKVHLGTLPYRLFYLLAQTPDEPVPYEAMIEPVWGWQDLTQDRIAHFRDRFAYFYVATIRKKLGADLGDDQYGAIRNVTNIGYMALSEV